MTDFIDRPFSRRVANAQPRIFDEFPEDGRIALVHVLASFVRKGFVEDWAAVLYETLRIGRRRPSQVSDGDDEDKATLVENIVLDLPWQRVFDLCERVYATLAIPTNRWENNGEYQIPDKTADEVREEMAKEIRNVFDEENLDYDFVDGKVLRATVAHTANVAGRANVALADRRLREARGHFRKAQAFFKDTENPDYRNSVKEAACAVEAAARVFFPTSGATLGDIVATLKKDRTLPPTIAKCFEGLYAFRNSGQGVAHGGATGGEASRAVAEFVLASAASQILLLIEIDAEQSGEIPF